MSDIPSGTPLEPPFFPYRYVTSEGLQKKYPEPLLLSENPLDAHYLDIAQNIFGGIFQDSHQGLETSWTLDIRFRLRHLACYPRLRRLALPVMVCELLALDMATFDQKTMGEGFLYKGLVTQYYLRMLERLLQFCQDRDARTLMMVFKGKGIVFSGIYTPYSIYSREVKTRKGKEMHLAIRVMPETLDSVLENLYSLEQQIRQRLWKFQRYNPVFRKYLKDNPL